MSEAKISVDSLVMRYRKADKFWLTIAGLCLLIGALIPSGALGMVMLILSKAYLGVAEDA